MKEMYERRKTALLTDKNICEANKNLFKRFLEWEEDKLIKINDLNQLDDACFKTLISYLQKFANVNQWFNNQPLKDITAEDFKKVYNGLERGIILTKKKTPFKDKKGYYHKIFCSKPFRMINKSEMAKEIIEEHGSVKKKKQKPKFIKEEEFRILVDSANLQKHKLLLWLAFDYGENIFTLLKLKKSDFEESFRDGRIEYTLFYREEILKRARTKVSDINNYDETAKFLKKHLETLKDEELLFDFSYHSAVKFLKRAVKISKIKCRPHGGNLTWRVLRKSMFTDLARKGFTALQIKKRAGHKASSSEIDVYLNLSGIDDGKEKKKVDISQLSILRTDLINSKNREKRIQTELDDLRKRIGFLEEKFFSENSFLKKATHLYLKGEYL